MQRNKENNRIGKTKDLFKKIREIKGTFSCKAVWYVLSPSLFNLYAEYIMKTAWLDESQAIIWIAGRNINNLQYADTTLMAESEEELKSFLMNGEGGKWKSRLQTQHSKN